MSTTNPGYPQVDFLPNGIQVITEPMSHVRSVSVGVWVKAGSRGETPEENGVAHFIEHMLFKGTASRTAEDIARSVDSIGGNLDAFTAKELVCFNTKVLDEHLPRAFDILSDLVLNPLFTEEDIQKEKGVVLEELKMEVDNPEYLVHDVFSSSFWKGHPLGRPILGTKDTVQSFTPQMVRDFYHRAYAASNVVITAAGNLSHQQLVDLVARYFGGLPAAEAFIPGPSPKPHAKVSIRRKRSLEQAHLCLGVPCFPLSHAMRYPGFVLNTLLGGGMSSRLFQNIREKRGLAYAVFTEQYLYSDSGCLSVYAGLSPSTVRQVIDLILEEFRQLKEQPIGIEELTRAKDHLKGSVMLGLESTGSRMSNIARQAIYFGRFFTMDEMVEEVNKVTADDVQRVCQEFFTTDQIAVTVLGNLNGFKLTRDDLLC
jgi:predicted Zn-dependent peptidase